MAELDFLKKQDEEKLADGKVELNPQREKELMMNQDERTRYIDNGGEMPGSVERRYADEQEAKQQAANAAAEAQAKAEEEAAKKAARRKKWMTGIAAATDVLGGIGNVLAANQGALPVDQRGGVTGALLGEKEKQEAFKRDLAKQQAAGELKKAMMDLQHQYSLDEGERKHKQALDMVASRLEGQLALAKQRGASQEELAQLRTNLAMVRDMKKQAWQAEQKELDRKSREKVAGKRGSGRTGYGYGGSNRLATLNELIRYRKSQGVDALNEVLAESPYLKSIWEGRDWTRASDEEEFNLDHYLEPGTGGERGSDLGVIMNGTVKGKS